MIRQGLAGIQWLLPAKADPDPAPANRRRISAIAGIALHVNDQLLRDCHMLGTLDRASVLLNRNAAVGWLILVPDTVAVDWHELDDAEYERVTAQLRALSRFSAGYFATDKLNVAALGNQVRQMHIHVIARQHDDPCWPQPVWGHLETRRHYTGAEVEALRAALAQELALLPQAAI